MSPQHPAFANNIGGVPLPKDKKQQQTFAKEFQPGKIKLQNTDASEFIPTQPQNLYNKKDGSTLEESEAFQEMNNKKEMNDKFNEFLTLRSKLISSNETDTINIENIKKEKENSIEMDIEEITKKQDNQDKKIQPYFSCLEDDTLIVDSLKETKIFMLPECY